MGILFAIYKLLDRKNIVCGTYDSTYVQYSKRTIILDDYIWFQKSKAALLQGLSIKLSCVIFGIKVLLQTRILFKLTEGR